jgi:hypothetical protein
MDIEGIPVVCRGATDEPVGNAVKDSMLAKVGPHTSNVTAVIYGSLRLTNGYVATATQQLAALLVECASATECRQEVVPE